MALSLRVKLDKTSAGEPRKIGPSYRFNVVISDGGSGEVLMEVKGFRYDPATSFIKTPSAPYKGTAYNIVALNGKSTEALITALKKELAGMALP